MFATTSPVPAVAAITAMRTLKVRNGAVVRSDEMCELPIGDDLVLPSQKVYRTPEKIVPKR